jgi:UDP-glucose 4-epimerase
MRWLITGGCGFLGANLVRDLVSEGGHAIRIVDNLSVGTRADLARACTFAETAPEDLAPMGGAARPVELVVGDILDERLAPEAAAGAEVIVHLAANTGVAPSIADPRADCHANVLGTLNYLEAGRHRGVARLVFASSGAPLGEAEPPLHEELAGKPTSPYGASKLAGEAYCSAYHRAFGLETVALRFGNVYGPLSSHKVSVVAKFIKQALGGESLEVYGDGDQSRDFIFVDDLVGAVRRAAEVPGIGGEVFQIATSRETTVNELLALLLPLLADAGHPDVAVRHGARRRGEVRRNVSDTRKAAARLDWRAETQLADGLAATLAWFLAEREAAA